MDPVTEPTEPSWADLPAIVEQKREDAWRARPITHTGELAVVLGGSADSFTGELLRLIAKADPWNRRKLLPAFPREVVAYAYWMAQRGPTEMTYGELTDHLTALDTATGGTWLR